MATKTDASRWRQYAFSHAAVGTLSIVSSNCRFESVDPLQLGLFNRIPSILIDDVMDRTVSSLRRDEYRQPNACSWSQANQLKIHRIVAVILESLEAKLVYQLDRPVALAYFFLYR